MLDDFIKKADKVKRTIEIIGNNELPCDSYGQLVDALKDESFSLKENLIYKVFEKLDELYKNRNFGFDDFAKYNNILSALLETPTKTTGLRTIETIIYQMQQEFVSKCAKPYKKEYKDLATIFKSDRAFFFFILNIVGFIKDTDEEDETNLNSAVVNIIIALNELGEIALDNESKMCKILDGFLQKITKTFKVDWVKTDKSGDSYILGYKYFNGEIRERNKEYNEWIKRQTEEKKEFCLTGTEKNMNQKERFWRSLFALMLLKEQEQNKRKDKGAEIQAYIEAYKISFFGMLM